MGLPASITLNSGFSLKVSVASLGLKSPLNRFLFPRLGGMGMRSSLGLWGVVRIQLSEIASSCQEMNDIKEV